MALKNVMEGLGEIQDLLAGKRRLEEAYEGPLYESQGPSVELDEDPLHSEEDEELQLAAQGALEPILVQSLTEHCQKEYDPSELTSERLQEYMPQLAETVKAAVSEQSFQERVIRAVLAAVRAG